MWAGSGHLHVQSHIVIRCCLSVPGFIPFALTDAGGDVYCFFHFWRRVSGRLRTFCNI
jgi:hypothetical protein